MKAFIAVTDPGWLDVLRAASVREVNFWQPRPTHVPHVEGTPWIFKIRGTDRIGGFGYFSYYTVMPLSIAWETFGVANGASSDRAMSAKVRKLRHTPGEDDRIGCVVLADTIVLDPSERIAAPSDWSRNTVRGAGYDLDRGEGARVWQQLLALTVGAPAALSAVGGYAEPALVAARRGQGAFRLMVMDAYGRRCAVSGERTLPVLEAAHIRPFVDVETHDVRNGLLLRSDLHRLYDRGLVTVDADLRFRVSRSIARDYSNGKIYYALEGRTIATPSNDDLRPSSDALAWHAREIFVP